MIRGSVVRNGLLSRVPKSRPESTSSKIQLPLRAGQFHFRSTGRSIEWFCRIGMHNEPRTRPQCPSEDLASSCCLLKNDARDSSGSWRLRVSQAVHPCSTVSNSLVPRIKRLFIHKKTDVSHKVKPTSAVSCSCDGDRHEEVDCHWQPAGCLRGINPMAGTAITHSITSFRYRACLDPNRLIQPRGLGSRSILSIAMRFSRSMKVSAFANTFSLHHLRP